MFCKYKKIIEEQDKLIKIQDEQYRDISYELNRVKRAYQNLEERFSKLDFEIYYITLYIENEEVFAERLNREGKATFKASEFTVQNSINQQKEYLKMAEEIKEKYPNIKVINIRTDRLLEDVQKEIREKIGY